MALTVAFAGKGGVGKTTLAGTLARLVARQGRRVVAVDADLNPNLGISLGLDPERAAAQQSIPTALASFVRLSNGTHDLVLNQPFDSIVGEYGIDAPDGVELLMMGRPDHAGSG